MALAFAITHLGFQAKRPLNRPPDEVAPRAGVLLALPDGLGDDRRVCFADARQPSPNRRFVFPGHLADGLQDVRRGFDVRGGRVQSQHFVAGYFRSETHLKRPPVGEVKQPFPRSDGRIVGRFFLSVFRFTFFVSGMSGKPLQLLCFSPTDISIFVSGSVGRISFAPASCPTCLFVCRADWNPCRH